VEAIPVPVKGMVAGELGSELVRVRVADWAPMLVRVMVWVGEAEPMAVVGKVRELCESWKVARMEGLAGVVERIGVTVPVKSRMVGLLAASDSRMREPVSVRGVRSVAVVGSS